MRNRSSPAPNTEEAEQGRGMIGSADHGVPLRGATRRDHPHPGDGRSLRHRTRAWTRGACLLV